MDKQPATAIVPTHTPSLFSEAVRCAAFELKRGGVVVLPTETVYGLAANAFDSNAVARIYAVKGRPARNPVIVHVSSLEMARSCVKEWPVSASRLASAFWPGPLTLVLCKSHLVPDIVTAGGATVALRLPSHPLMRAVIEACGFPLAAPSANLSTEVSPTTAAHCAQALRGRVELIVDGGPCQVGIESTVVDLTAVQPHLLRPGMISIESIRTLLGTGEPAKNSGDAGLLAAASSSETPRSPGMMDKHYAPRAKLLVWRWKDAEALQQRLVSLGPEAAPWHILSHSEIPLHAGGVYGLANVSVIPHDPEAFARALYSELHGCDARGVKTLIVEAVPAGSRWEGIADRLRRAAFEFEAGLPE